MDFLSRVEEAERRDNEFVHPGADPTPKYVYSRLAETWSGRSMEAVNVTPAIASISEPASAPLPKRESKLVHRVHDETGGAAQRQAALAAAAAAQARAGAISQRGQRCCSAVSRATAPSR
eukprot:CAMPEP_0174745950 /NCGR_PEP_ID=MMETSP1094-20130205/87949_1 /TAXON_ID=156173 /ORGANISM="Chrysochromulina brevifilum, Strain UTEX LB 985" /LENGTH=119 /DNA_ID=CAMNT_0015950579 /DNA_START=47 /DNA_END=403 /DNA_ORIENTATION=+